MGTVSRIFEEIHCICHADRMILNDRKVKTENNRVNLHFYRPSDGIGENLGDYLSRVIIEFMCRKHGIDPKMETKEKRHLYAVGSILQMGYQDATVWGGGFAFELGRMRGFFQHFRKLDIRCVRGPKTRETLRKIGKNCLENYGDPVVLMPLIYEPQNLNNNIDYIVIPHYSMERMTREKYGNIHILSMNTTDYEGVIDRICSAQKVVSSSLHGIVLAEAYGIPAVFYQDRVKKFTYKYDDWYLSTNRNACVTKSIEEAICTKAMEVDSRRIKHMQETLIRTFPIDLWGGMV